MKHHNVHYNLPIFFFRLFFRVSFAWPKEAAFVAGVCRGSLYGLSI